MDSKKSINLFEMKNDKTDYLWGNLFLQLFNNFPVLLRKKFFLLYCSQFFSDFCNIAKY